MTKKKIKVRVKKRKLRIRRILICLLTVILLLLIFYFFLKSPIRNIYIIGNSIVSDREIIELSNIEDYPSFLSTSGRKIISKLKNNVYISDVGVKKKWFNKLYIHITEKKILCMYNNLLLFEDGMETDNIYDVTSYPILLSDISNIKDKFISKFSLINDDILFKISEIEYAPNEVDDERFILRMNDGNLVYITLNKVEKINKYNSIYSSLEGKKGIIYLDSGDYVEIKEE